MIRTFHTSATDRDFRAMIHGKGSPVYNLLCASLPIAIFLFLLAYYVIWRSLVAACIIAALTLIASAWSNFRFFGKVECRKRSSADTEAVKVTEIQASRVLNIEPLGSNGPALVFFANDGKALLLAGQRLLRYSSFPCKSFRLYQWTDTGELIRIETTSRGVKPEQSEARLNHLAEVKVFEATPETLQDDLDRAFDKTA